MSSGEKPTTSATSRQVSRYSVDHSASSLARLRRSLKRRSAASSRRFSSLSSASRSASLQSESALSVRSGGIISRTLMELCEDAPRTPTARRCGTQTLFTVHLPLGWADGVEGADSSGSGKPSGVPWV